MKRGQLIGIFIAVYLTTGLLGQSKFLRSIPGEAFIFVWLVFMAVLLLMCLLVLRVLSRISDKHCAKCICQNRITHVEMPMLFELDTHDKEEYLYDQKRVWINGYYLLRLYLRGIVKYEYVQNEKISESERNIVRLMLDEQSRTTASYQEESRSEAVNDMIRYLQIYKTCSIRDVLLKHFNDMQVYELDGRLLFEDEIKKYKKWESVVEIVTVSVIAYVLGIGQAKLFMGLRYNKPSDFLMVLLISGLALACVVWRYMVKKALETRGSEMQKVIRKKFSEEPHEIDQDLVTKVNTILPQDCERNRLLNAYLYEDMSCSSLFRYASNTPENSFMECLAREVRRAHDEFYQEYQELKARQEELAKARAANASGGFYGGGGGGGGGCGGGCGGCGD